MREGELQDLSCWPCETRLGNRYHNQMFVRFSSFPTSSDQPFSKFPNSFAFSFTLSPPSPEPRILHKSQRLHRLILSNRIGIIDPRNISLLVQFQVWNFKVRIHLKIPPLPTSGGQRQTKRTWRTIRRPLLDHEITQQVCVGRDKIPVAQVSIHPNPKE